MPSTYFWFSLIFVVLNFGTVSSNPQAFANLIGYKILADVYLTLQTSDVQLCAQMCADSSQGCVGIYRPTMDTCQLLVKIRDIVEDPNGCFYYVADRRNDSDPQGLTTVDQYTFYNAFIDGMKCPKGWNDELVTCSNAITEEMCGEYAEFFNATFNGTFCVISSLREKKYTCLQGGYEYQVWQDFCYFNVSENVSQSQLADYYGEQCALAVDNSSIVSLHSRAEETWILNTFGEIYIGLYIPASVAWNKNAFRWADGTPFNYKNWAPNEPRIANPSIEERVVWLQRQSWLASQRYTFNWVICKVKSATYEYV